MVAYMEVWWAATSLYARTRGGRGGENYSSPRIYSMLCKKEFYKQKYFRSLEQAKCVYVCLWKGHGCVYVWLAHHKFVSACDLCL